MPYQFTEPPWVLIPTGTPLRSSDGKFGTILQMGLAGNHWAGSAVPIFTSAAKADSFSLKPKPPATEHQPVQFGSTAEFAAALRQLFDANVTYLVVDFQTPDVQQLPQTIASVLAELDLG
jgi:hypothetical protein